MNKIALISESGNSHAKHIDEDTGNIETLDVPKASGRCADCGHPLGGLSVEVGEWDRYEVMGRKVCVIASALPNDCEVLVQHRAGREAGPENRGVYHLRGRGQECATCGHCRLQAGCSVVIELDEGESIIIDDGEPR